LHTTLVAGQCNIAWNVLTSWNPVTRNGGSIYNEQLRHQIKMALLVCGTLMHSSNEAAGISFVAVVPGEEELQE